MWSIWQQGQPALLEHVLALALLPLPFHFALALNLSAILAQIYVIIYGFTLLFAKDCARAAQNTKAQNPQSHPGGARHVKYKETREESCVVSGEWCLFKF